MLTGLTFVRAPGTLAQDSGHDRAEPTVVLVHGAWADASSWSGVVKRLQDDGYAIAAVPNPLRSLSRDAAQVAAYPDAHRPRRARRPLLPQRSSPTRRPAIPAYGPWSRSARSRQTEARR
jgi:pimeloyl-ACP methyl ester carboxylesterase